jgi:hypothetical protein
MAVQEKKNQETNQRPKLEERFIINLKGKDFVLYAGLLDMAHQKGLQSIMVDPLQYPTKDNGFEAIAKATVESKNGDVFVELGDANPRNTNKMIVNHIIRMAATRAKARALRDFVNVGIACIDELGDLDEVVGDENSSNGRPKKTEPANPEPGNGGNGKQTAASATENGKQDPPASSSKNGGNGGAKRNTKASSKEEPTNGGKQQGSGPKPSTAQIRAIENLARRRNISSEELEKMVQQQFGTALPNISSTEASSFIRTLQQSA